MKKIGGWVCTTLVIALSWAIAFFAFIIISAFIWPEEGAEMAGWYVLVLLIAPAVIATFSGIAFYGKFKEKHFPVESKKQLQEEPQKQESEVVHLDLTPEQNPIERYEVQKPTFLAEKPIEPAPAPPIQADPVVEAIKELKYSLREQKEIHDDSLSKAKEENETLKAQLLKLQEERNHFEEVAKEAAKRDLQDKMVVVKSELLTIDLMEGREFEKWCAEALKCSGFSNVTLTPGSGDQGVDITAEKDGLRYAFQCKRFNSDLGNTPVQEVYTGARYYNCHVGVVLTNRNFTTGAKDAAGATGVLLWGRPWVIHYLYRKHGIAPGTGEPLF